MTDPAPTPPLPTRYRRAGMPRAAQLAAHWGEPVDECWLCGVDCVPLQRAHILALFDGGGNEMWNLLLLCPTCHRFQEAVSSAIVRTQGAAVLRQVAQAGEFMPALLAVWFLRRHRYTVEPVGEDGAALRFTPPTGATP